MRRGATPWNGPRPAGSRQLVAGKYRIVAEVGRGGMGVVYRAEDTRLKRPVALKFLSDDLSARPEARARFLREAQAAAGLDNPHVCAVYEAGEHDGRAYIAMAFIEGGSLKERIAQGPLALAEALTFSRQIAEGLAGGARPGGSFTATSSRPTSCWPAALRQAQSRPEHRRGAAGRRESPTSASRGSRARARPRERAASWAHARLHVARAGAGAPDRSASTDIWSVGCVIDEMLAGRAPFSPSAGQADSGTPCCTPIPAR